MAARALQKAIGTLQRDPVKIWVTGTGAGAADLTGLVTAGGGVTLIDQTGTGLYTITLRDKYAGLLMLAGTVIDATTPDDWEVVVVSETVATTKLINIAVFKGGALADLTTDEKLMLEITLRNTAQTV